MIRLTQEVTEDLLKEVAGEDTIKLVGLLKDKNNISEFKLAETLRVTVNTVRNMLYRLQEHNLVTSTRKKDKEKGWYIYYWTFNTSQARNLSLVVKQKKLTRLKEILEIETQEKFYICPQKCTRFKIENAMEYSFKCPECGTILKEENNAAFIRKLGLIISELEESLTKPMVNINKPKTEKLTRKTKAKTIGRSKKNLIKFKRIKENKKLKKLKNLRSAKKLKLKKNLRTVRKLRVKKIKIVRKPKIVKKSKIKIKKPKTLAKKPKIKKKTIVKKAKPKKRNVFKKVTRFLKRK